MIHLFTEHIEKTISSTSIVLSSDIQKHFGPDNKTVYLKGNIIFIDSSNLEISMFVIEKNDIITIDKYRFHYMNEEGIMLFRYDNAPHHREVLSFPHHKHTPKKITKTTLPQIKDILNEISAIIIKNSTTKGYDK
jgi:hypothetical protein